MSNQQQFQKNTDVPSDESYLWELGDGWKISKQADRAPYCDFEHLKDEALVKGVSKEMGKDIGRRDYIDYAGFFFVPKASGNKILIFAYEDEEPAKKKLEIVKKFDGQPYTPKTTIDNKPKPPQQQQGRQILLNPAKPVVNFTNDHIPSIKNNTKMITFLDPQEVKQGDKVKETELFSEGYSYLTKALIGDAACTVHHEKDGTPIFIYQMGKLISVDITDNK